MRMTLAAAGGPDSGERLFFDGNDTRGGAGDPPSFTIEGAAGHITRDGTTWGYGTTISYSFRSTAPSSMPEGTSRFSQFNAAQINATILSLQAWSDVAAINFTRVGSGTGSSAYSNNATILFSNYGRGAEGAAAFAFFPGNTNFNSVSGDAWFNSTLSYNTNPVLNGYGRLTLIHEIGHTLGLAHPGDYNAGEGNPSYEDADYREDSGQFSVMSYWDETETGADFKGAYAAAPLLDDIAAAQLLYGANMTTRTGDTVYGFNSNTDRDFYSATNASTKLIFSVWDAGGFDTLDFSGYGQAQTIDLRQGEFSSVGGLVGNVSIAQGAVVERAIGGSGIDTMFAASYAAPIAVADLTKAQSKNISTQNKALSLEGQFGLQFDTNIASSTTIPHATVNATARGGGQEYYAITVTAGQQITIDLDTPGVFDGFLTLRNGSGTVLASVDDGPADAGGVRTDPFLSYTFTAAGTYYIAIGSFQEGSDTGGNLTAGAAYALNVSLTGEPAPVGALIGSTLEGRAGNDILNGSAGGDILNGGEGADRMIGGLGNDVYVVDNSKDVVIEAASAGIDRVDTSITYALGADVEKLTLIGDAKINGTGNALANTIIGNAGQNKITGGVGADTLTGGGKTDTFIYLALGDSTVGASDLITDLTDSMDKIDLSRIDGNTAVGGVQGFEIVDAFTSHAGELVLSYDAGTNVTSLMVDVNGDGVADMLVRLTGDHESFDRFVFGGG